MEILERRGVLLKLFGRLPEGQDGSLLLIGSPGPSDVGNNTIRILIDILGAKEIAEIYFHGFSSFVQVMPNGTILMPHLKLYSVTMDGKQVYLMFGNASVSQNDYYEFSDILLAFAREKLKVDLLVLISGFPDQDPSSPFVVYGAASNEKLLKVLRKSRVTLYRGQFFGAEGYVLALARRRGINSLFIASRYPAHRGLEATERVLRILARLVDIRVDLSGLRNLIEKARRINRQFSDMIWRLKERDESSLEVV